MCNLTRTARSCVLFVLLALVVPVADADPPLRVLRLSYVNGVVSFNAAGTDDWVAAPLNRPVVYGDQLWADADGRGELALGQATLWLGARTSVRVLNLDDRTAQFEVAQGTVSLRVRRVSPDDTIEIDTPNLAFVVAQPGRYQVSVDEQGEATLVAVRDGLAEVYGGRSSYAVARGQAYRFFGTDLTDSERSPPPALDAFERFAQERDRRFEGLASAAYVSPEVIGYEDLDQYGTWSSVPEYGNVWTPRNVAAGWVPYREGHWSWVDPWGWTWVDDAPWGFAPFHYGRWIYARDRWGWVPGPSAVRPVYGPAFVAFVDAGSLRLPGGGNGPAIGWFPLGPRDVYRPSYAASAQYIRQVNLSNTVITNVTVLNGVIANPSAPQGNAYVNLRAPNAVTAVPPAAMAQAQAVTRIATVIPATAIQPSNIEPYARVAPAAQAMVGPARRAQAKPPVQVETRPVVARRAPPPPPMPVSQRLPLLQQDPGKPAEVRAPAAAAAGAAATRPAAGAPAPTLATAPSNVRVVNAPKPAATAAPPARAPDGNRAAAPRPPAGAPAAASPGAGSAATVARPAAGAPPVGPVPAVPGGSRGRDTGATPPAAAAAPAVAQPPAAATAPVTAAPRGAVQPAAGPPPAAPKPAVGTPPAGPPPAAAKPPAAATPPGPATPAVSVPVPAPRDDARARDARAAPGASATEPGGRPQAEAPRPPTSRDRSSDNPQGPALLPRAPSAGPRERPLPAGAPGGPQPPAQQAPESRPPPPRALSPAAPAAAVAPAHAPDVRPPPARPPEKAAPARQGPGDKDSRDNKDKDKDK